MRSKYIKIYRILLCLALFIFPAYCFQSISQIVFTDGFESGDFTAGGWIVCGNAQISTQSPASGIYCAQGTSSYEISKSFIPVVECNFYINFKVKASQTNTDCMVFCVKDAQNYTSSELFFNSSGEIIGLNGSGPTNQVALLTYSPNTWYSFKVVLNMVQKQYDIYINDELVADDFCFYSMLFTPPEFFSWGSADISGTAFIDDVSIYSGASLIKKINTDSQISFFHLPGSEIITINCGPAQKTIVKLTDLTGRLILRKEITNTNYDVNISGIRKGYYMIYLMDTKGNLLCYEKILKK